MVAIDSDSDPPRVLRTINSMLSQNGRGGMPVTPPQAARRTGPQSAAGPSATLPKDRDVPLSNAGGKI